MAHEELVAEGKAGLWSRLPSDEFQVLSSNVVSKYRAVEH